MLSILLITTLSCADANWIAEGVATSKIIPVETKVEILENILDQCIVRGDAKAD